MQTWKLSWCHVSSERFTQRTQIIPKQQNVIICDIEFGSAFYCHYVGAWFLLAVWLSSPTFAILIFSKLHCGTIFVFWSSIYASSTKKWLTRYIRQFWRTKIIDERSYWSTTHRDELIFYKKLHGIQTYMKILKPSLFRFWLWLRCGHTPLQMNG